MGYRLVLVLLRSRIVALTVLVVVGVERISIALLFRSVTLFGKMAFHPKLKTSDLVFVESVCSIW